ncbi:CubicO group peptidase (beta-lactamase class C family) [Kutzneria buriramensis]|uniref:CubicO group peptidase (Beta-lactamase class C family) n=1 Tax=Kutzneria buriramensis TaxID=1045776 RepID=A0A3E0HKD4_9PSEU|nr:CubicO group peptidase (beta-lactamase class C family) [Kutzneria buriramensis]
MLGLIGASGAVLATGALAGAASAATPGDLRAFDQFLRDQGFSGSYLFVHRGRTVAAGSYGRANDAALNGPDTRFAMASVTKLFTAVAIAQLAQARKIGYGDKLGAFLSGFPAGIAETVTVHHLLTHTSGLGDVFTMPGYLAEALSWTSVDQVMNGTTDYIRRATLGFPPGAGFEYSNAGYHLLGMIVARVSGQSYYDYVREQVFRPAGMTSTDFYLRPQWHADPRIAHPYAVQPSGEYLDSIDRRLYVGTPAGDAFSTCADMARFARALQGSTLLDAAFTPLTLGGKVPLGPPTTGPAPAVPPVAFQCYGPMKTLANHQWVTGHSGGAPGTSTDFQMYLDSDWVSVILSNRDFGAGGVPPWPAKARELITA